MASIAKCRPRGIWQAGGVAVPLSPSHPVTELEYVIDNSQSSLLVAAPEFENTLSRVATARNIRFVSVEEALAAAPGRIPPVARDRRAMILFTSGAALVANPSLTLEGLRRWARDRLAPYKIPSRILLLDELPRSALGKVIKQRIRLLFQRLGND